ncbi:IPExxxVDY family protein [Pedobacter sp. SYP-B3415]|uniref:IPExxxVDY family protein n=1 Tax=Pedobacter sp. SYP-B3415 TaxID=2496641 RepID=UPI00101D0184|nr:IPExxxVDY family protein [Pedobacter sp. SYP-B3415]
MNRTYLKLTLDLDFTLIAITAPLRDYVLCHKINNQLGIELERVEEHEVYLNADEAPLAFSKYCYFIEDRELEYYILANRNPDGFLVPEMSRVDFFMIIRDFIDEEDLEFVLSGLNKLPDIQVAARIDPHKLKSRENLVI